MSALLQDALYHAERELAAAQSKLEQQQSQLAEKASNLAHGMERHQVSSTSELLPSCEEWKDAEW